MKRIYLDNGSTSFPKAPGVGESIKQYIENIGVNINRGGYEEAYGIADAVFEARSKLKTLFNFTDERNVIFVPSVTYALNFLITGIMTPEKHLIISGVEHNAVARAAKACEEKGSGLDIVPCDKEGFVDIEAFEKAFRENTALVVIAYASNVSGTLQDIEKISEICKEHNVPLVLDAAQAAGAKDIDFKGLGLSGLCVPGHKGLLGPQGIGAMLITDELAEKVRPVIHGGTGSASDMLTMPGFLPDKFEPGTMNLPGIVGLSKALDYIISETPEKILSHELRLADRFMKRIDGMENVRIVGTRDLNKRVGVVSLDFIGRDNADIAYEIDSRFGIMTRCGLHCAPLSHRTFGTFPQGTVRFAFGRFNTEEDVDAALRAIETVLFENK